jgi:hypothetical protein
MLCIVCYSKGKEYFMGLRNRKEERKKKKFRKKERKKFGS